MSKAKTLMVCSVLAASAGVSQIALAEAPLTGNIGFTSNYIWRGITQSGDEAAISGGLDYAHESGFYLGTWVSSLGGGQYEQDLYAGYGFKAGPVDLDIGYISYMYPIGDPQLDFAEVYVNGTWDKFKFGIAQTIDSDAGGQDDHMYLFVGADFEIAKDLTLGLLVGDYDFDGGDAADYSHWQVSLSKDDFTFAIDKNDGDVPTWNAIGVPNVDDMRFTVSYSKSFDLM